MACGTQLRTQSWFPHRYQGAYGSRVLSKATKHTYDPGRRVRPLLVSRAIGTLAACTIALCVHYVYGGWGIHLGKQCHIG